MHGRKTVGRREAPSNANPAVNGRFISPLRDIYAEKIGRFIAHSFSIYPTLTSRCERRGVDNNRYDNDTVLCECDLPTLQRFVEDLETRHEVKLVKAPGICLTMVRAEDSLEKQEFFLGEALTADGRRRWRREASGVVRDAEAIGHAEGLSIRAEAGDALSFDA